ncbi:MAG: hypothetical protein ACOX3G_01105 [Armatimonadota bacterium]
MRGREKQTSRCARSDGLCGVIGLCGGDSEITTDRIYDFAQGDEVGSRVIASF